MGNVECEHCDKYRKENHNYCRMCGYHLTRGVVQNVRVALAYFTEEKFCGYCGKKRNNRCKCTQ